jgi:hypothetical protein
MPSYSYRLSSSDDKLSFPAPSYAFIPNNTNTLFSQGQCIIQFNVPADLKGPVFMYYRLTKFYQNHRRYVKSMDSNQLKGQAVSFSTISNGDCKPLGTSGDKIIYPCGLIANSIFNGTLRILHSVSKEPSLILFTDTLSNLTFLNSPGSPSSTLYTFSETGIAWPGEAKKYAETTSYSLDQIVPPPNWAASYPNNYTTDNPPPNLQTNEHFQNWMRIAGLPTFSKLYGRNDHDTLQSGTYYVNVTLSTFFYLFLLISIS